MIAICPRCGRSLKDWTPLALVADRLMSETSGAALTAWAYALDNDLIGHECNRVLVVTLIPERPEDTWSSDFPGFSGPPDLVVIYANDPRARWRDGPLDSTWRPPSLAATPPPGD